MRTNRADISRLADLIRAIERPRTPRACGAGDSQAPPVVPTGWGEIDGLLGGGLPRGAVHEWCGVDVTGATAAAEAKRITPPRRAGRREWTPPLCILAHLAWQTMGEAEAPPEEAGPGGRKRNREALAGPRVVWVGRRCWPYGRALVRGAAGQRHDTRLLRRSIFVDPPDVAARVWAIELALRSPAVAMVLADGSGFDIAATRRLQLAAEAGLDADAGAIALLARPPDEERELSVAVTRWRVAIAPTVSHQPAGAPRWAVALRRCKGAVASVSRNPSQWILEWRHEKGLVFIPADVVDRPGAAKAEAGTSGLRIA